MSMIIMSGARQLVTKARTDMQMIEDVVMDGVQLLVVVILLLGRLLIQMHGGSAAEVHLQEGFGTDHAGTGVVPEAEAETEVGAEAGV